MNRLLIFQITTSHNIQILIDEQNKVNIYGYASEELRIFDEVEVKYIYNDQATLLAKDIVQEVVSSFSMSLERVLNNELSLDRSLAIGQVGYCFSKITYTSNNQSEKMDNIFPKYWVWSSKSIQTWLYSIDNKIYLEISPTYSWLFSAPQNDDLYISFDKYINNYKPIAVVELEKPLLQTWIDQCHAFLQTMKKI